MIADALALGRRLRRRGVVHAGWGIVERGGRSLGTPGVVLFVVAKLPLATLAANKVLPKHLRVTRGTRSVLVPVDVQAVPVGEKHAATARAGDRARVESPSETATLSALFAGPNGLAAAISGHAGGRGDVFTATLANGATLALGTVAVSFDNATIDAARIDGIDPAATAYLSTPYVALRDLSSHAVGIVLTVRLVGGDATASVAGVDMAANFGTTMTGLIKLAQSVSNPGDSGAPALDYNDQLVGFVVGGAGGCTYLIPARGVFDALG